MAARVVPEYHRRGFMSLVMCSPVTAQAVHGSSGVRCGAMPRVVRRNGERLPKLPTSRLYWPWRHPFHRESPTSNRSYNEGSMREVLR